MAAILNSAILDSAILVFLLKLTHTCQDWFPPFAPKNLHSFILTQLDDGSYLEFYCCWIKKTSPIHSDSTWWWQSSWILPCWIQTPCFLLSDSLKNTLTPLWFWLKVFLLIQSDSNSFILTQLDDGSNLEFGHHGLSHLIFSSQTHSHLPGLVPTICTKKTTLTFPSPPFAQKILQIHSKTLSLHIHSDSTWWWQPSWILPCWIKKLHSFILTQPDDGSHLEFCHVGFRHLVFFSQIHSKTLSLHSDSDSN